MFHDVYTHHVDDAGKHPLRADREIVFDKPSTFLHIMVVYGVELSRMTEHQPLGNSSQRREARQEKQMENTPTRLLG